MLGALITVGQICFCLALLVLLQLARRHQDLARQVPVVKSEVTADGGCPTWANWLIQGTGTSWHALAGSAALHRTDLLLTQAGRPWGLSAQDFLALRFSAGVGGSLLSVLLIMVLPTWLAVLPLPVGYLVPDWLLKRAAARRQAELQADLPDLLDLVVQALEAECGLEAAIEHAGAAMSGASATEIHRLVQELRLNTPRLVAFKRLSERNPHVRDLRYLVVALREGYRLGTPIAATLHQFAHQIRRQRGVHAKELAAKAKTQNLLVGLVGAAPVALAFIAALLWLNFRYNPAFASLREGF